MLHIYNYLWEEMQKNVNISNIKYLADEYVGFSCHLFHTFKIPLLSNSPEF